MIIKKNTQLIINHISSLENRLNKRFDQLNINNNQLNNQVINYDNGRYVGQVINGLREGKGIEYFQHEPFKGDRYEGDFRNDNKEGKGIYYWNDGGRYEGNYRNHLMEGKGILYFNNGDRYEGDYLNGEPIGKHAVLTKNGEVKTNYY